MDPHIFADPDPGTQNLVDPTDPDPGPKHWPQRSALKLSYSNPEVIQISIFLLRRGRGQSLILGLSHRYD